MISRSRSVMLPLSRRPPAMKRWNTRGLRASVMKRSSGGRPCITLSSVRAISGEKGGEAGCRRWFMDRLLCAMKIVARYDVECYENSSGGKESSETGLASARQRNGQTSDGAARFARSPLGTARDLGAARGARAEFPRSRQGVWRFTGRAERAPGRVAREFDRGAWAARLRPDANRA